MKILDYVKIKPLDDNDFGAHWVVTKKTLRRSKPAESFFFDNAQREASRLAHTG
jgi:hypothetical protein